MMPEVFATSAKLRPVGSQHEGHSKGGLAAFGVLRGAGQFQDLSKVSRPDAFWKPLGTTWSIWGAVLAPIGFCRAAPKLVIF